MNRNDQEFLVQKIRTQYTEKEHTKLDALRALDRKVKRPVNIFAYVFGIVGALVLGSGMSLTMDVIEPGTYLGITIGENMMLPGILVGLVGLILVSLCYPLYGRILDKRKKKYADRIIALAEAEEFEK